MNTIYTYKSHNYQCKNCNWTGKGEVLEQGDLYEDGFEVNCPACGNLLELVVFPTFDEVLKYGTEEEKKEVKEQMEFWEQWEEFSLKSIDQLPEIEGDNLIFEIEERKYKRQEFLFILNKGKEIWKEPLLFEYYDRFIEIGIMLKEKYGNSMQDLVPPGNQGWLLGDKLSAAKSIEAFRNSLK